MSEDEASSGAASSSSFSAPPMVTSSSEPTKGRRPPPPPPPRRPRRPSQSEAQLARPMPKPVRPRLGPAPAPPESRRRSPSPARVVLPPTSAYTHPYAATGSGSDPSSAPSPSSSAPAGPRLLSPIPIHSPLPASPNASPSPPQPLPLELELEPGVPPPIITPAAVLSPPRPPSPDPFALALSPPSRPPPLPPPPADPPPTQPNTRPPPIIIPFRSASNPNLTSEAASLQGIPYPSDDMFLDSENLSTLEKIFLFANSSAAYHRLFVARTLPEWLPSVDPHEAVEYILPLLNGLGTDSEDTVRETFAPALARVMWYFFSTCLLTEDEQPLTPSAHSDEHQYPPGPPTISVSSFTPLLGSLLLSVNRGVGESARWGVVQVLLKLKEDEEAETAPPPPEMSRKKAKELEKEKARRWEGWVGGPLEREKREMIRRELILGVVLGMARLEEDEEQGEEGEEGEGYDVEEMEEMREAARTERRMQVGRWAAEQEQKVVPDEGGETQGLGFVSPVLGADASAVVGPEPMGEHEQERVGNVERVQEIEMKDLAVVLEEGEREHLAAVPEVGEVAVVPEESPSEATGLPVAHIPRVEEPKAKESEMVRSEESSVADDQVVEPSTVDSAKEEHRPEPPSLVQHVEKGVQATPPASPKPLPMKLLATDAEVAEDLEEEVLPVPGGYSPQLAEGTTTFLLQPLSPRSISFFTLASRVELDDEDDLPMPGGFSLKSPPLEEETVSSEPITVVERKLSPSPPQQSDEDTPAMTIDASPADSNESPSAPLDDTPLGMDSSEDDVQKIPPGLIGLVAQASELGMANMSPDEVESVSPLHRSDTDTPTSAALTPSDSGSTVKRISPQPPSEEEEEMDIVDEAEEQTEEPPDVLPAGEAQVVTPAAAVVVSPPLEQPVPPEYFPSPPINFPPPQQPVTPSLSPPDWLPVPPSPGANGPPPEQSAKTSPLALIASLALMSAIASSAALPPPDLEGHFLPELLRIASQADEWVRREAGFVIGALAKAVTPAVVRADLVPLLLQFSTDPFWHVRHSSLFSAPPILSRLTPEERRNLGLQVFLHAANDPSRAVRSACLELLGEAIAAFKDDEQGPPDELVQLFLGDPNERPEDTESDLDSPLEWFSTPGLGLKPVRTSKRDADRCLVCAFNFPAVALTLGKEQWPRLRDYYLYLARDKSLKVRRTLASSLGALAEIIGPEATQRDLVHVWKRSFEPGPDGVVDEDVVGWAIESIEGLLKAVNSDFSLEVVESLQGWWTGIMAKRWRLREQVAMKLPALAAWAHVDGVPAGLRNLLEMALTDDVAAVRESAGEGVSGICAALRGGPGEEPIRQALLDLSEHASFRYRMTFIACIQSLLADEMKDDLSPLWPRVWALGSDPVVDVRISVARLVATAVGMDCFFRDPVSRPHLLNNLIRRLIQDPSYQVRSFVAFLRGTHNVTPVTTPVRGASLMSPSAKFSRPPLVLSPSGSIHDEPAEIMDDRIPGMDDTKEFYSAIIRGRDMPLPVFTLPPSPRHLHKVSTPLSTPPITAPKTPEPVMENIQTSVEPEDGDIMEEETVKEDDTVVEEPIEDRIEDVPRDEDVDAEEPDEKDDPNDPFADSMADEAMEQQDVVECEGNADADADV